jgi:hypothetical protein
MTDPETWRRVGSKRGTAMLKPVSVPQMRYRQFLPLNDPRIGEAGMWSDKTDTYLLKLCGAVVDAFQVYEIAAWFTPVAGRLVPPSPRWRGVFGTVNDCAEREFEMVFCQGIYGWWAGGLGIYEAIGEDVRRGRLTAEDQWPLLIAAAIAVADDPVFQDQKDKLPSLLKTLAVWTDEPVWTPRPINQDHHLMYPETVVARWRAATPEPAPEPASVPPPPPEAPKPAPAEPVVEPRTLH